MAKKKTKVDNLNTYLIVALVVVLGIGLYFTLSVPMPKAPEPAKANEVVVTSLGSDCDDCFDLGIALTFLGQQKNLDITSTENLTLKESKDLAEKYNLTKLPAVIVTGDIEGLSIQNFNRNDDALVFSEVPPPYYDIHQKRVRGKLALTIIDDDTCEDCFDITLLVDQLNKIGVPVAEQTTLQAADAKDLIATYDIKKIPTLIFNSEAGEYDVISSIWDQVGTIEDDGSYVLRMLNPPCYNLETDKLEGIVDVTYVADETCDSCFNASMVTNILRQSFSMAFGSEQTLDVSSPKGKLYVDRYDIELVPAIILSEDASAYPTVAQAWQEAGTVEKDGKYIFRNVQLLQGAVYKNLTSGEIVGLAPEPEESTNADENSTAENA